MGWDNDDNGQRRSIEWDDENRIQKISDPTNTLTFAYDDSGTRVLKRGQTGQTAYVNQFFTVKDQALASKHIFAGTSRIATKVEPGAPVGTNPSNKTTESSTTTFTTATTETETAKNKGQAIKAEKVEERSLIERVTSFFTNDDDNTHPGKGVDKRNDRANEVAQNTVKNPNLNGGTLPNDNNKGGNGNNGNNSDNGNDKDKTNNGNTDNNGNSGDGIGNDPLATGGTFLYYYHPDHLGSTGYVTDEDAELYEHIEYFPFGETWISEAANSLQRVPYRYTAKEFDEETGLYYYGARYYDPRTSVWQSVDPILGSYLDGKPNGGVFNSSNLAVFIYVNNNPLINVDPNGKHALRHHEQITRLTFGSGSNQLSQSATNRLVKGNLDTDTCETCQGSGSSETNKHATRGYKKGQKPTRRLNTTGGLGTLPYTSVNMDGMQSVNEAKAGAQGYINSQVANAAELARKGEIGNALESLGAAMHTAQDRLQHDFEVWPFEGIGEAATKPVDGLMHLLSDNYLGRGELQNNKKATQQVFDQFKNKLMTDYPDRANEILNSMRNFEGD